MKAHLSRRALDRKIAELTEQLSTRTQSGYQAMRALMALTVQQGGFVRVSRENYDGITPDTPLRVERESMTGDILIYCGIRRSLRVGDEMSFEELQARLKGGPSEAAPSGEPHLPHDAEVQPRVEEDGHDQGPRDHS